MKKTAKALCIILSCLYLVSCSGNGEEATMPDYHSHTQKQTSESSTESPSESVEETAPTEDTDSEQTNTEVTGPSDLQLPDVQFPSYSPSTQKPSSSGSSSKPSVQKPVTQSPTTQSPSTQKPSTQKPDSDTPDTTRPAIQWPDIQWPDVEIPDDWSEITWPSITLPTAPEKPVQTPTEQLLSAIDALHNSTAGMATMSGTTQAAQIMNQTTQTTQMYVKTGNTYRSYMTTTSDSALVKINDTATGANGKYTYYKDGDTVGVSMSESEYVKQLGPTPEKLIPYTITESTIKSITKSDNVITVTLDPNAGCAEYKNRLASNASRGGATFKSMDSVTLTFTFTNGAISSMSVAESYTMQYTVIVPLNISCSSQFTYTFKTGAGITIPKI